MQVLFIWKVPDRLRSYLEQHLKNESDLNLIFPSDDSEENLISLASRAEVMIGWRPTEKLLENAENLRVFINPGVGVQHLIPLMKKICDTKPIKLINGHGNTFFTAQHAVALLLTLTNRIIPHHEWMKSGRWRTGDKEAKSIPLRDKTIGLLGYGHINQQVHKLLSAFPVKFAALRRSWDDPVFFSDLPTDIAQFTTNQMPEFLESVDFLIIALPQTTATIDLIKAKELGYLGKKGYLINISRGPVVNEKDLYNALKSNQIAGAALDVWYEYHPKPDDSGRTYPYHYPFHELSNVVLSPHRAASPFDDLRRWDEVIENLRRIVRGRTDLLNVVDLEREY